MFLLTPTQYDTHAALLHPSEGQQDILSIAAELVVCYLHRQETLPLF